MRVRTYVCFGGGDGGGAKWVRGGRCGDAGLERRCVRAAARHFEAVRTEDLGRLPARVVAGLLGEDGLAAEDENQVCQSSSTI